MEGEDKKQQKKDSERKMVEGADEKPSAEGGKDKNETTEDCKEDENKTNSSATTTTAKPPPTATKRHRPYIQHRTEETPIQWPTTSLSECAVALGFVTVDSYDDVPAHFCRRTRRSSLISTNARGCCRRTGTLGVPHGAVSEKRPFEICWLGLPTGRS